MPHFRKGGLALRKNCRMQEVSPRSRSWGNTDNYKYDF